MIVHNQNIYDLTDDDSHLRLWFIFQSFRLFSALTVIENIQLSLDIKGTKNSDTIAHEWMENVGLLTEDHLPEALSVRALNVLARVFPQRTQVSSWRMIHWKFG